MKNSKVLIVGIIVALLVLVMYTFSFQVRFDEVAVVTRFGKATEESVINREGDQGGWKFKLPRPIDTVKKYNSRTQVLDVRAVESQTADEIAVIVQTYLAWRIADPLEFYRSVRTVPEAESQLRAKVNSARNNVIAQYTFDQMTNRDPSLLKLEEMEERILSELQKSIEGQGYGIELKSVGIKRILLSSKVTEQVFARMKQTRARKAQSYKSDGESKASAIIGNANTQRKVILSFADARAAEITSEGESAAAAILGQFAQNEDLAIFQRQLEALEAILKESENGRTTIVIDQNNPVFQLLNDLSYKGPAPAAPAAPAAE